LNQDKKKSLFLKCARDFVFYYYSISHDDTHTRWIVYFFSLLFSYAMCQHFKFFKIKIVFDIILLFFRTATLVRNESYIRAYRSKFYLYYFNYTFYTIFITINFQNHYLNIKLFLTNFRRFYNFFPSFSTNPKHIRAMIFILSLFSYDKARENMYIFIVQCIYQAIIIRFLRVNFVSERTEDGHRRTISRYILFIYYLFWMQKKYFVTCKIFYI